MKCIKLIERTKVAFNNSSVAVHKNLSTISKHFVYDNTQKGLYIVERKKTGTVFYARLFYAI